MNRCHFNDCDTLNDCWCEVKRYGILFGIASMILIAEVVGAESSPKVLRSLWPPGMCLPTRERFLSLLL